jgi:hypothetical protein
LCRLRSESSEELNANSYVFEEVWEMKAMKKGGKEFAHTDAGEVEVESGTVF